MDKNINELNDNELLMLYYEDDENAKNLLYMKYKFIIDILIRKYSGIMSTLKIDYQEMYSECTVGFSDGINSYNDNKDTSLATFITLCIERRIRSIIKKYNRKKYKAFQDTYSLDFIYEDSQTTLLESISDDGENDPLLNMTEDEKYQELFDKIKNSLTKTEFDVFILLTRGLNYQDIAKIQNKKPKQIDNAIQRIKIKVRKILKNEND